MWQLFFDYSLIFTAMLGATILLPGLMIGVNHAFKHVFGGSCDLLFGYSKKEVMGLLPLFLLGAGICGVVAGLFGIELIHLDAEGIEHVSSAIGVGALFGFLNVGFVNIVRWLTGEETVKRHIRLIYRIASWLAGGIVGTLVGKIGIGIFLGLLVDKSVGVLTYGYAMFAFPIVVRTIMPFFILSRFTPIICNHCFRCTEPLKASYKHGVRYCEWCENGVEHTREPGKVALTFGNISLPHEGRIFLLADPDFESKEHRIDLAEVYIDTASCDKRLFERFITFIVNYPPKDELESVHIFHQGTLEQLGPNLSNVLRNLFVNIHAYAG